MKYQRSNLYNSLSKWFLSDLKSAHLRKIEITEGKLRGLTETILSFEYPITAIAGKNGSGKSTVLALACCAYHNTRTGHKAPNRKHTYYTFADFFIQHKEEIPATGITIKNHIAYDKWKATPVLPSGEGVTYQTRKKSKKGKWNEYASRVKRNVAFIGIERIVPHSEKSQSKSYNRHFKSNTLGCEEKIGSIVGYILNKNYEEIKIAQHSKYRLPIAKVNGITYSGFNMGAGENALFEIFTTICTYPKGSLIVIDEIELGLHIEAQKRFIKKLKEVCLERQIQIICTTHSSEIFSCLPEEARIFIETLNERTVSSVGSSPEYAFAKLSAENSRELDIFVEDDVAKTLIVASLPSKIRSRVNIEIIGSASAVSIQLSTNFKFKERNAIAILDGDQRKKLAANISTAARALELEKKSLTDWFTERCMSVPGDTWPEQWILKTSLSNIEQLSKSLNIESDSLLEIIHNGMQAGKHNEFYEIGRSLSLPRHDALYCFCINLAQHQPAQVEELLDFISSSL